MNSVHEQCPNSDSETVLSQKLGQVHHVHSHSSACAHRLRPGRAHVAVSQPKVGRIAGLGCRIVGAGAVSQRVVPRAWLPCPGFAVLYCNTAQPFSLAPCHNTPRCIAIQRPTKPAPQSQYNKLYCNTVSPTARLLMSQYTLLYCDTIPSPTLQPSFLQYNSFYCNTISASLLQYTSQPNYSPCHNTIVVLQHKTNHSSLAKLAIHLILHYKTPSLAIQLGSSPNQFCTNFFFLFSIIFFQLFPATGKYQIYIYIYIYIYFFIFQNTQINL